MDVIAIIFLILAKYFKISLIEPLPAKFLKYKSLENFHFYGTVKPPIKDTVSKKRTNLPTKDKPKVLTL